MAKTYEKDIICLFVGVKISDTVIRFPAGKPATGQGGDDVEMARR
jgi:hypothetical protein